MATCPSLNFVYDLSSNDNNNFPYRSGGRDALTVVENSLFNNELSFLDEFASPSSVSGPEGYCSDDGVSSAPSISPNLSTSSGENAITTASLNDSSFSQLWNDLSPPGSASDLLPAYVPETTYNMPSTSATFTDPGAVLYQPEPIGHLQQPCFDLQVQQQPVFSPPPPQHRPVFSMVPPDATPIQGAHGPRFHPQFFVAPAPEPFSPQIGATSMVFPSSFLPVRMIPQHFAQLPNGNVVPVFPVPMPSHSTPPPPPLQPLQLPPALPPVPPPQPISCELCGRTYTLRKSYVAHMRRHRQKFGCSYCAKVFPARHDLRRHLSCVHGIVFTKAAAPIVEEMSLYLGGDPGAAAMLEMSRFFQCEKCGRNFNQKSNLRRHESKHCHPLPAEMPTQQPLPLDMTF